MAFNFWVSSIIFLCSIMVRIDGNLLHNVKQEKAPSWIVNFPKHVHNPRDVRKDPIEMNSFPEFYVAATNSSRGSTDGEDIDVVEHFFWGLKNGVAIELGGLDGCEGSMTYKLHQYLNWYRVVIEANPMYRDSMKVCSADAFGINAAICKREQSVHYSSKKYVGGIVEFMSQDFMKRFAAEAYNAGTPPGNLSSIEDWSKISTEITEIRCIPLANILKHGRIHHVNYFLLDVEGAELEVLESFNFDRVTVDVFSVETEPKYRPPGYAERVVEFMKQRGYEVYAQVGRNHCKLRPLLFLLITSYSFFYRVRSKRIYSISSSRIKIRLLEWIIIFIKTFSCINREKVKMCC